MCVNYGVGWVRRYGNTGGWFVSGKRFHTVDGEHVLKVLVGDYAVSVKRRRACVKRPALRSPHPTFILT
jgi:hypothetical protein